MKARCATSRNVLATNIRYIRSDRVIIARTLNTSAHVCIYNERVYLCVLLYIYISGILSDRLGNKKHHRNNLSQVTKAAEQLSAT